jgi:hypothetical protein
VPQPPPEPFMHITDFTPMFGRRGCYVAGIAIVSVAALQEVGVPVSHGSCSEVYREKAFQGAAFRPRERLPYAAELGEYGFAFAVNPTLTADDLNLVRSGIDKVFKEPSRTPLGTRRK